MKTTKSSQFDPAMRKRIYNMLEAALEGPNDSKKYAYRDGYSDESIAASAKVSLASVQTIRKDWFGELKRGEGNLPVYAELVDIVRQQGQKIAALEARMNAMAPPKPVVLRSLSELGQNQQTAETKR